MQAEYVIHTHVCTLFPIDPRSFLFFWLLSTKSEREECGRDGGGGKVASRWHTDPLQRLEDLNIYTDVPLSFPISGWRRILNLACFLFSLGPHKELHTHDSNQHSDRQEKDEEILSLSLAMRALSSSFCLYQPDMCWDTQLALRTILFSSNVFWSFLPPSPSFCSPCTDRKMSIKRLDPRLKTFFTESQSYTNTQKPCCFRQLLPEFFSHHLPPKRRFFFEEVSKQFALIFLPSRVAWMASIAGAFAVCRISLLFAFFSNRNRLIDDFHFCTVQLMYVELLMNTVTGFPPYHHSGCICQFSLCILILGDHRQKPAEG